MAHNVAVPPSAVDPALAAVLRRLRAERGLSQQTAASAAGISIGSYAKIERAQASPAWVTVRAIAHDALGVSLAELGRVVEAEGDG